MKSRVDEILSFLDTWLGPTSEKEWDAQERDAWDLAQEIRRLRTENAELRQKLCTQNDEKKTDCRPGH